MNVRRACLGVVLLGLSFAAPQIRVVAQSAPGDEEQKVQAAVSVVMHRYMTTHTVPGAVVGVSLHGRRYFFHYGKATDAGDPFTPDTVVEIGSNTKTFTTTLFALALANGQMQAGESIQKHMPDNMKLEPVAQRVTPLQLASFQSGMPDDPTNLPTQLEMRGIEHYTTKDFLNWVAHWKPAVPPPAPYKYSNAGIGLLGYLVMDATGKSWEEQAQYNHSDAVGNARYRIASQCRANTASGAGTPDERTEMLHPGRSLPGTQPVVYAPRRATCCAMVRQTWDMPRWRVIRFLRH